MQRRDHGPIGDKAFCAIIGEAVRKLNWRNEVRMALAMVVRCLVIGCVVPAMRHMEIRAAM
jgi:hypothetical protein